MIKKALPIIISMIITGCIAIPNMESPAIEGQTIQSQLKQNYQIKREKWWTELNNHQLNQLMTVVLDNNKDLKLLNIKIARIQEQYQLNNANKKIGVDLEATAKKQRLSGNSFNPAEYSNRVIDNDSLSLNANYDVDLFNKTGNLGNQYISLQSAEIVNKQWSELNISNQVVKLYADFTFYNNQARLLIEQKEIYQELLELEEYKVSIGTSINDEVLKLKNNIKDMNTLIVNNTTSLQLNRNSLMLLGNNNEQITKILAEPTVDLYKTELKLPESYTAEVITERPDVKYYLYSIEAQEEQLEALKADFYPNITITGTTGFESITPNLLLSKSSLFATIAPTLKLPIFDSGRIKSNYKLAGLDLNTFIENYNKTISTALKDVNDNVYKLKQEQNTLNNSISKYENKKTIFNNMNVRYEYGIISRYEFVQERDQILSEERNNNQQLLNRFNQQIDLINSLGGINITNQKQELEMQQQEEIVKGNSNKAISRIIILLLVVAIIGGFYAYLWNTNFKWHEETEDAYVNSHQNVVTSQLSGNIVKVLVDDTQIVKRGDLIAQIDNTDYLLTLEAAKVELEQSIRKYYSLNNNVNVSSETVNAKKVDFQKNEADYKRDTLSFKKGLISQENYDVVKNNYNQSKIQYTIAQNNFKNDKIQLVSENIKKHPDVAKSIINYQKAAINLARTNIYATFDGTIAKRAVYLGQKINENQNLFTIVDLNNAWVDANLKENQLKNLKAGQAVEIISDVNKKHYEGVVKGVSAGSGSAFSLLPAQNATGNWIKVVQRVPVKIEINEDSIKEHGYLPIGSSVVVDINTHTEQQLKSVKPLIAESTNIFDANYTIIDKDVDTIVKATVAKLNQ